MIEILNKYVNFLWERFMADMNVLSNPWMYIPFLIPFIFYMMFFVVKWYIILFPITLPLSILKGWFLPIKIAINNKKEKQGITSNQVLTEMHEDLVDKGVSDLDAQKLMLWWSHKYETKRKR